MNQFFGSVLSIRRKQEFIQSHPLFTNSEIERIESNL